MLSANVWGLTTGQTIKCLCVGNFLLIACCIVLLYLFHIVAKQNREFFREVKWVRRRLSEEDYKYLDENYDEIVKSNPKKNSKEGRVSNAKQNCNE